VAAERIALVLAGGGARGAYEAGALSVILPALERRGERPTMYVGTSVGSLNAVALAAWQELPVAEAVERLLGVWLNISKSQVIRRIIFPSGPLAMARYAGELLSVPGLRLSSILDPSPLRANLAHWIDWSELHASVAAGAVDAVAAVTTSTRTGRTRSPTCSPSSASSTSAPRQRSRSCSRPCGSRPPPGRAAGTSTAARA
jgi:NTE family protein